MSENSSIQVTLEYIKRDVADIKSRLNGDYVTKESIKPLSDRVDLIWKIVMATLGGILTFLLGFALNSIFNK